MTIELNNSCTLSLLTDLRDGSACVRRWIVTARRKHRHRTIQACANSCARFFGLAATAASDREHARERSNDAARTQKSENETTKRVRVYFGFRTRWSDSNGNFACVLFVDEPRAVSARIRDSGALEFYQKISFKISVMLLCVRATDGGVHRAIHA